MEYKATIELVNEGTPFFCTDVLKLIKLIDELKSVREAAEIMKITPSKAWKMIRTVEAALGETAVFKARNAGVDKYTVHISPACRNLVEKYTEFEKKSQEAVKKIYGQVF